MLILVALRKLTHYEKDFTHTNYQIGLALKTIMAQLMNSILVPAITNIYIKNNIYEANGQVYDIFFLAITNSFLPPID